MKQNKENRKEQKCALDWYRRVSAHNSVSVVCSPTVLKHRVPFNYVYKMPETY